MKHFILFTLVLLTAFLSASAQSDSLDRIEVVTYTRYNPVLTSAKKLNTIPIFETPKVQLPVFQYELPEFRYAVQATYAPAKAIGVSKSEKDELNDNFFRIGGGNYLTGLAEIHLHNTTNKTYDFGGHAKHFSSNANKKPHPHADFSDNSLGIFGTKTTSKGALGGQLNYDRHVVHFYAFPDSLDIDKQFTNQIFNDLNGKVSWSSNERKKGLGFKTSADFFAFSTVKQSEQDYKLTLNPFWELKKYGRVNLDANVDISSLSYGKEKLNRTYINIDPSYTFTIKKFDIKAGLHTVYVIDSSGGDFFVFPDIEVQHYIVPKKLKAYLDLGGGIQKNHLRDLSYVNPFLNDYIEVQQTVIPIDFKMGLKGVLGVKIDYLLGISFKSNTNLPLFLSDTMTPRRFSPVYDTVGITAFQTGLGVRLNEKFFIQWSGNFYTYNVSGADQAWQLPDYDINLNLRYTLASKLNIRAQLYVMGERFQQDLSERQTTRKLKPFGDISLMMEYRYKKHIGFFLNLNNISNARYQKWYDYPSYGMNVLAGVSFSL